MDSDGITIHYNSSPATPMTAFTAMPVLKKVRKEYGLGRIIKGWPIKASHPETSRPASLMATGMSAANQWESDGDLKEWVLSDAGYAVSKGLQVQIQTRHEDRLCHREDGTETKGLSR